ncbi:MAG: hypothetical protein GH155_04595 [Spirochaeta sp.]|nr:hypothetical protein [Spirochaeta sp.]
MNGQSLFPIILLFLLLALPAVTGAETFAVYTEESLNHEKARLPLPIKEGILDSLFEMEHMAFDLGPPDLSIDWQQRDFSTVISLAGKWEASYLILSRIQTTMGNEAKPEMQSAATVQSDVIYYIIAVSSGELIDQGQLSGNNNGREKELDYQTLCFNLGSALGKKVVAKAVAKAVAPK